MLTSWCSSQTQIFWNLVLFRLFSVIDSLALGGSGLKSSQEYPVSARVPQGCILGPTLFLLNISHLPDDIVCNIAIIADDTTLSVISRLICGHN